MSWTTKYWLMKFNSTWTSPVKLAAGANRLRKPQNTHLYSSAFHRRPPKFPEVQAKQPSFTGVFKSLIRTWLFLLWSSSYYKKNTTNKVVLHCLRGTPYRYVKLTDLSFAFFIQKLLTAAYIYDIGKEKGQE